ncbi:homeobox-leucine zipper protein athb-7 [Quercus suber]|uniref:Homeobox-leucine zipper protein n=1 Tax=Quercus suber TaxID=58331 RepID=A0AAW0LX07_QUESU
MASKRKNKNMQRFSDEQIKLLEIMFEEESRPETRIKQKLANELGLHPRQLQKLKNMLDKQHGKNGKSSDNNSVKGDSTSKSKEKPSILSESVNHNINMFISDANCEDAECTEEEPGMLNIAEPIDGSLTSSEDWCSFLDQSSGNSQWWEL